jgi:hypothetical protein
MTEKGALDSQPQVITGRHDIPEILLKVALKHQKSKSNHFKNLVISH